MSRWGRILAPVFLACLLACITQKPPLYAQTINPTGRDLLLETPLTLNGSVVGSILTTIDTADSISLETDVLLSLLQDRTSLQFLAAIQSNDRDGLVSLESLEPVGIDASFDLSSLSVVIEAPADLLGTQNLRLKDESGRTSNAVSPERYSGYLNFRTVGTRSAMLEDDRTLLQATGGLDASIRVVQPALALGFDVIEDTGQPGSSTPLLRRRYARITTDLAGIESRMAFGDVDIEAGAFSGATSILGFTIGRDFELLAERNVRPTGQRSFSIERPSSVTVLSDGQRLRTFNLAAGNYNLADVPLATGDNNLLLLIEDDTGRSDTIDFSTFFDNDLLAPGEFDYAISLGLRSDTINGEINYRQNEPAVGLSARAGTTPTLTLGASAKASRNAFLLDAEALLATPFGPVTASLGGSRLEAGQVGWALATQYNSSSRIGFSTGAEYRSAQFESTLSSSSRDTITDPIASYSGFVSVSSRLPAGMSVGFSATAGRQSDAAETLRATASLARSGGVTGGLSWVLRATHQLTSDVESNNVTLNLSYQFNRQTRLTALLDQDARSADIDISRQVNSGRVGGYDLQISANREQSRQQATALNLNYTGNRYEFQFGHNTRFPLTGEGGRQDVSTVRLASSLVFAGRAVAFSRPVRDSFAIVGTHPTLDGRKLRLSPSPKGDLAWTDWLGKAVIPDLGLYNTRILNYSVDELPLGYDLGAGTFFVAPPLGAGYSIQVGSGAVVTVIGVLSDQLTKLPIELTSGTASAKNNSGAEPVEFFTNRTGKFVLSGVAEGEYVIELNTSPVRRFTLRIPADSTTLYRVGTIEVP